jgi:hypothetical protein
MLLLLLNRSIECNRLAKEQAEVNGCYMRIARDIKFIMHSKRSQYYDRQAINYLKLPHLQDIKQAVFVLSLSAPGTYDPTIAWVRRELFLMLGVFKTAQILEFV